MHDDPSAPDVAADGATLVTTAPKPPRAPAAASQPQDLNPYQDDLRVPPVVDLTGEGDVVRRTVALMPADHSYAPTQLAATTAWAYDGTVPGPTFVAHKAQTVHVRWVNQIDESHTLPYRVLRFNDPDPSRDAIPQNAPGMDDGTLDPAGAALADAATRLTAATVTHLHGGRVASDSDGWTENVSPFRHAQHTTYHDRPRSAGLWYHDHALGVTRLNVYAGLFGLWLIRDEIEQKLIADGVLPGGKDEIGLVIQDRNLDKDDAPGGLNGKLLHKTETSTAEMFGPYTAVDGVIWPRVAVGAGPVRLRLLNGSNARTFCLKLVRATVTTDASGKVRVAYSDADKLTEKLVLQVGTDGGLLGKAVRPSSPGTVPPDANAPPPPGAPPEVPDRGLVLAPAERADLVVDFSRLKPGDTVALVNTAFAPFHGSTVEFPFAFQTDGTIAVEALPDGTDRDQPAGNPSPPAFKLPNPHVMLFEVKPVDPSLPGASTPSPLTAGMTVNPEFKRFVMPTGSPPGSGEEVITNPRYRWIALTEFPAGNLYFRELEEVTPQPGVPSGLPAGEPLISITDESGTQRWYRTAAMAFHDAVRILINFGSWEVWNLLNLTGDTHPIHLHLVEFQAIGRFPVDTTSYAPETGATLPGKSIDLSQSGTLPARPLDDNEAGYKDTVRVNPGEVMRIAAKFDGYCGRYMYHCHILEHEDMDMMRPFVVVNPTAADAMAANGMGLGAGMGPGMGMGSGMSMPASQTGGDGRGLGTGPGGQTDGGRRA